jgi:hypothetical protein
LRSGERRHDTRPDAGERGRPPPAAAKHDRSSRRLRPVSRASR